MKNSKIIVAVLFITCSIGTLFGQSLNGKTVEQITKELQEKVNSAMSENMNVLSIEAFNLKQKLSLIQGQLESLDSKNDNRLFEKLPQSNKDNLMALASVFGNDTKNLNAVEFKQVSNGFDNLNKFMSTFKKGNKTPRVDEISRSFLGRIDLTNTISIKGANLNSGQPYISYNNEKFYALGQTDNSLEFELPFDEWGDSLMLSNISVELITYRKKRFVQKFKLHFTILPDRMGTFKLLGKLIVDQRIERQINRTFSLSNGHCQGFRERRQAFAPTSGWKIDVTTITAKATSARTGCSFNGLRDLSPSGFKVSAGVRNSGSCSLFGKDARGKVTGVASWTEYRIVQQTVNNGLVSEGNLYWDEDLWFDLPTNLADFRLEIDLINGSHVIINGTNLETWFRVIYDESRKVLMIKPNSIDEIFRASFF